MRIEKLELLAYGPFKGLELDLSAPGLHVVFGRNEAGKSTTLRAITGLLYGIDARTPDAHLHKGPDLRIGGVLVSDAGERVRVVRRKGNVNTLLDDGGQPVDEAVVLRLLRGVTEETFRHAFGLDHDTLQRGAQALLEGRGDLGESLFDASVGGGGDVQRLLLELAEEADKIYKPRGSVQPLNEALRAFSDAQKEIKETQSLPDAFVKQEEALEQARAERGGSAKRRAELASRKAQIERARGRVPLERRRAKAEAERAPLVSIDKHAVRIRSLAGRVAAYERALRERHDLQREASRLRDRVAEALRRAGVASAGEDGLRAAPRLDARAEGRVLRLVSDRAALADRVAAARTEVARAERELAKLKEAAKGGAEDASELARAAERARALGDAEGRFATDAARVLRRRKDLEAKAAALGLFTGTLEALIALRLPSVPAIDELAARFAEQDRALARVDERAVALATDALAIERQIAEQTGDFAPPEPGDLRVARARREAAWAKVREADAKGRASLEVAFEGAVRDADVLADRMIHEADRVTVLARLRKSQAALDKQRSEVEAERARIQTQRATLDAERLALFADAALVPRGLAEMRSWLERHAQIVEESYRLREAEADVAEAGAAIDRAKADLRAALGDRRERLGELLDEATRRLAQLDAARRASEEAARGAVKVELVIEERTTALARDEEALAEARARLAELVVPLGLSEDASTDEVSRAIEALRELFGAVDERASVEARGESAAREAAAFEAEIASAVADLAPELAGLPALDAASTLAGRSADAARLTHELASIDERLAELGDEPIAEDLALLATDPEAILRAREEVEAAIAEIDREQSRLDQHIGGLQVGLQEMRVDSGAADASARAQEAITRVRLHAEKYACARLAHVILSREIERYREENQGPLLARATQLFSQLTLGAFSGVRAGFDEKDNPALRCVRAIGAEVDVTGLSEGTRDQLYLSLRLASLLRHAELGAAMPLVLDDVLIQSDDERSRATLSVLAEVATKMQVLFFTHHARLVELARASVPASSLVIHELSSAPPPKAVTAAPRL